MPGAAALGALAAGFCTFNPGNSSFNLQPFQAQTYYKVQDSSNNVASRNYTYFFNFCTNVDPTILPGMAAEYCNNTYPGGVGLPGPAFQYANFPVPTTEFCHRLGAPVDTTTVNYGLYDNDNPSRGLYIQYTGGDSCGGSASRSLKVWLLCDPDAVGIPDTELVEETQMCAYEIFVRSAYGCPAECPIVQDPVRNIPVLCGTHGLCDFDAAIGTSRCFCNGGFEGKDCTTPTVPPPALSAVGAVLIAVGIFLAMTLGFLVYLWMRIRSLRLDPTAYSALRAGPDGEIDNTIQ
jgi:hypothetical protein